MANPTMVLISSVTAAGGESSIGFTSIPTGYTDLKIVISGRTNRSANGDDFNISINSSTSSFTMKNILATGSAVYSQSGTRFVGIVDAASDTANTFSNIELYFPNYLSSNYKSYSSDPVNENNGTTAYITPVAGLWSNTAAITGIAFSSNNSATWIANSTFYLYGISNS